MYGAKAGQPKSRLFYEDKTVRDELFTLKQVNTVVETLLTRKQRNNGVARAIAKTLSMTGSCHYEFCDTLANRGLGFASWKVPGEHDLYFFYLLGDETDTLLKRLNRSRYAASALESTSKQREMRRRLRSIGVYQAKPKAAPNIAGANGSLVRHFQNSELTWGVATKAIAYALHTDYHQVTRAFRKSFQERGVATLRITHGFVFRVDFNSPISSPYLISMTAEIALRSTKDNNHPAYRRLRNELRRQLGIVSKAKKRTRALREDAQRWKRVNQILCA